MINFSDLKTFESNISPCKAYTFKGRIILFAAKQLFTFVSWFYNFDPKRPLVFEENPRTMKLHELIFFAYKYYVKNLFGGVKGDFVSISNKKIQLITGGSIVNELSIHIGGDLMPYKLVNKKACQNLWIEREDFFKADIIAANLETPIDLTHKPQYVPEIMLNDMNFNSSQEQFEVFRGLDFDLLSIANNHTLDMGYEGAKQTLAFLEKNKVKTCGVGYKSTHSIIEKKGIKIGFLSYTYSLNQYEIDPNQDLKINHLPLNKLGPCDITAIINESSKVKNSGAEYIILFLHTGNAYQPFPGPQAQTLFKEIASQTEVDFIVGGHPHNIQPLQLFQFPHKTVFGCYSLGDFIGYDIYQRCHLSLYLNLKLTRINGRVELSAVEVNSNYMEYKNGSLILRNFDEMMKNSKNPNNDKKIADLHQLYNQTILVNELEQEN